MQAMVVDDTTGTSEPQPGSEVCQPSPVQGRFVTDRSKVGEDMGDQAPDEALVREFLAGNEEAFDQLVRRYQGLLYGVAFRFVQNREEALDVAQETLIKVYRFAHRWRPTGTFRSWLLRIATNLAIDRHRYNRRRQHAAQDLRATKQEGRLIGLSLSDTESEVSNREIAERIAEAVKLLSENQQRAFVLRYYQGLTIEEVGEVMGVTQGTVKTHLFRATGKLRELLSEFWEDYSGR